MRVFHFNGRIARGTTDCGRSSNTTLQTRRSGATPSLSKIMKHGFRRLSKKITIDEPQDSICKESTFTST
ncbi:hypothetical protein NDU88_001402 [Pleurodeles waltl]|uniref:Uncharacterized protein n=1 Tax=Pleurodeles waltl TaxID=8319 RepID=A0AAV7THR3_PLEWA|nr:hypothetical protein NDU88_001402 [Pleurodeles waltl]